MSDIKKEVLTGSDPGTARSHLKYDLLKGEIEGIRTQLNILGKSHLLEMFPDKESVSVLLFIRGSGFIKQSEQSFAFQELSVFVPDLHNRYIIHPAQGDTAFLEIHIRMSPADTPFLDKFAKSYPLLVKYSECTPYKEAIKSEKTISRMIIHEDAVPRMSMGSVQTEGPDAVGAHEHPMLEQLFYGLKDNHCTVIADDRETLFEENMLLHIPLGSRHGVHVEEGSHLHYIWIDFFRKQEDVSYITESHILDNEISP